MPRYYVYTYNNPTNGYTQYVGSGEYADMVKHTSRNELARNTGGFSQWLRDQHIANWDDYRQIITGPYRTNREAHKAKMNMRNGFSRGMWIDRIDLPRMSSRTVFCSDGRRWDTHSSAAHDLNVQRSAIAYYLEVDRAILNGMNGGLAFKRPTPEMLDGVWAENNCFKSEVPEGVFPGECGSQESPDLSLGNVWSDYVNNSAGCSFDF